VTKPHSVDRSVADRSIDHLFRDQASKIVATLTRIFGIEHLELAEDVVQEALYKALCTWPYQGVPENPAGWIVRVARNRALDVLRRQTNWRSKEPEVLRSLPAFEEPGDVERLDESVRDDQLSMIFACCHPGLPAKSQLALTLKVVAALSTAEIGRALMASEATVAQRIVRAKRSLREIDADLSVPTASALPDRLDRVLEVLYLLFNEGYSRHSGDDLMSLELCHEARRMLALVTSHPSTDKPAAHALAALLSFQASRLPTRLDGQGDLLLLEHQDRSQWDQDCIRSGVESLRRSASGDRLTSYHLEAEISSYHALAPDFESTDWRRMLSCYDSLLGLKPSPVVAVNRLVPLAKSHGPEHAFNVSAELMRSSELESYYPFRAIRGQLLIELGRLAEATAEIEAAETCTDNSPVRRHLHRMRTLASEASSK